MVKLVDPKILGRRLREERERLGLTQTEVADVAGVRRITVYQYEKGDRRASLDFLLSVEHIGVCFEFVVRGQRPMPTGTRQTVDAKLTSELFDLVDRYAVDRKGRALHRDSRQALFDSLIQMSVNLKPEDVNRSAIESTLKEFAA